ncbi:hypothetical protein LSS_10328 [Leptospira santarosai serovar Shermani str. LT 821]|uniref:Uncharacterized protein n=1 Tax=Leptospira santarosai serovar Shermani str. LT 821 TaxID=758847 RepID=K8Y8C8_9LEPT|nr:hypothetical protein LSS_10328 [Leptospira santarosai serovar Shermani str. LT 821]
MGSETEKSGRIQSSILKRLFLLNSKEVFLAL